MSTKRGLVSKTFIPWDDGPVTTLKDVVKAWNGIAEAEQRYRQTLRAAIADEVPQVEISRAINRTREMLRRDAMTDEERAEVRRADLARKKGKP